MSRMPFKSKAQARLCYFLQGKGKNRGWDCSEWSDATDYSKLPDYVDKHKAKHNTMLYGGDYHTLYTGPKGGRYIIVNGNKRYV